MIYEKKKRRRDSGTVKNNYQNKPSSNEKKIFQTQCTFYLLFLLSQLSLVPQPRATTTYDDELLSLKIKLVSHHTKS